MIEIEQQKAIAILENVYKCKVLYLCPELKCYYNNGNYKMICEYRERAKLRRREALEHGDKQIIYVTCPKGDSKCYVVKDLKENEK